ncbi:MAG: endonuclease VIII [bacterium]
MPEGPEIRLAADSIAKALVNRKVTDVFFAFDNLKKHQRVLTGRKISRIETRGKAILTMFDNGQVIYSHNQLYGRWYVVSKGEIPETHRQLRLAIHNRKASAFLYSASDIEVLNIDSLSKHRFLSKLGPDLLSQNPKTMEIVERLRSERFKRRQLGNLLLDQSFVAGLGNYLRAEILLAARLHPSLRPVDCELSELNRLAREIIKLTRRSYSTHGVINPPSLVKKLKASGKIHKEEYRFSVYGRVGEHCYFCQSTIERIEIGGRHIYVCPGCQVRPG